MCKKKNLSCVWVVDRKNPSLATRDWHHSVSLVMPDSDLWGVFFYVPLTPIIDPNIASVWSNISYLSQMTVWTVSSGRSKRSDNLITKTHLFKYIEFFTTINWKFSDKNSDFFHISAQIIDCEYSLEPPWRGGSNEYPQSKFLSRNKKNNMYPCKPQFYYIKVRFKGIKII